MEGQTMEEQIVAEFEWTTPRGKTLQAIRKNPYGFLSFFFKEGGELPKELTGNYTNLHDLTTAAKKWIDNLPPVPSNIDKIRPELKTKTVHKKTKSPTPQLKTEPHAEKRESESI
jgi:hypothetical protein